VYGWGDGHKPVLLIHGWQSRGSRFHALAEQLLSLGYSPLTFDAPGHGDSGGNRVTILDYVATCQQISERYGCFEAVVAHSFGVPTAFYALKQHVRAKCLVAISGVAEFRYLLDAFSARLKLRARVKEGLQQQIEEALQPLTDVWQRFTVTYNPAAIDLPIFIVHDRDDDVADLRQSQLIAAHFKRQAQMLVTEGLGHSRVLCEAAVVNEIAAFIHRQTHEIGDSLSALCCRPRCDPNAGIVHCR